jgi:transposase
MRVKITFPPSTTYSEAFKRQIVGEYEGGGIRQKDLSRKYRIRGHCTILRWCRKYGRLYYPVKGYRGRPVKDPQKRKIKDLEQELREAKEKLLVYEKLIEITNRELGEDVRKKIVTKLSENWPPKVL